MRFLASLLTTSLGLAVEAAHRTSGDAVNNTRTSHVAFKCGPKTANVTCVNRYGSLLPPSFSRDPDPAVPYTGTTVPEDSSWLLVQGADFVLYDHKRGLELLGSAPKIYRGLVPTLNVIHEAPVFVPGLNKLFVQQDGPPGGMSIMQLDLNHDPPVKSWVQTDPPIYQPTGGLYNPKDGMIYYAVHGNNASLPNGLKQHAGLARVDPRTLKAEWLVNNYYGFNFAGPNDLVIDPVGDIWFTDTDYAYVIGVSDSPKQLQLATWRYRPSTGQVQVMDTSLSYPNGIQFSRDCKRLFIADSGLESYSPIPTRGAGDFYNYPLYIQFNSTGARNIYAWDVARTGSDGKHPVINNKRVIFQSLEGAPDGLKVAANGYLVVAGGLAPGVDIIDDLGNQIARIQTSHPVENIQWSGHDLKTIWLVGIGGITKVEFDLAGPDLSKFYQC
ncbi:Six-bladed beta-propeller, TolB-like protein [Metarhizium album ARSEF 1941]|uniref:Six-bladed beta-propeller, TolB-like protein n=1 Tax=Metarhizium album (strain ARSEF 1941) TaxID=1081103 RepID=A0A0B2WPI9_METAS|nr:Six-bladed beta-propeller, TolB-like protein [Metarhizium album ARSEF 1941]KHN94905.1 Six-bladed beta-propeller, TolB-like protein [Metarhizium album ARSEF 1941]